MAYPEDEQNGVRSPAVGFTKTNLADPGRVPIGASPEAYTQRVITSLLPRLNAALPVQPQQIAAPIITAKDSQATNLRTGDPSWMGIREREEFFKTNPTITGNPQIVDTYKEHKNALDLANQFLTVQSHMQGVKEETRTKLDSANFIGALGELDHTSPDFERLATKLLAKYPRATGSAVSASLAAMQNARQQFLHGTAKGGADQFGVDTPERHAYELRYAQTKNPLEAQAHAENTLKGEEMIRANVAKGLFDVNKLAWVDGKPERPEFFTAHGTPNYHAIALDAAKNESKFSKETTVADREEQQDVQFITKFPDPTTIENNPELKTIYGAAVRRQAAREAARVGTSVTRSARAKTYTDDL